ncbi:MAG: DUF418 domain-containing protein [Spirosomataceae bacterium]
MTSNSTSRIQLIDGLRGFALLGIILAHYVGWHAGWSLPPEVGAPFLKDTLSQVVMTFDGIFITGKFFAFFSFLFGVSFGLMLVRNTENKRKFLALFAWRIALLGFIGLVHHLHWRGDILSIYALVGFGLLLFVNVFDRVVLIVAILLILNLPTRLQDAYMTLNHIDTGTIWGSIFDEAGNKQYLQLIRKGEYWPFLEDNWNAFPKKMKFQVLSGRIYITFGFFLLGFWFSRKGLLQHFQAHRLFFRKTLIYSASIIISLILVAVGLQIAGVFNNQTPPPIWLNTLLATLYDLLNASMVLFYVAGISFLLSKKSWQKMLEAMAVIGKMALTSYLTQTLVGWIIFFGFGFDLLGRVSPAVGYLIGIGVFLAQIVFSKFWLNRFYYGPVEWAWRSLTYFKVQAFLKR